MRYGFIEFEDVKACEQAIKMDETLIDDRRIHADFNQSVSKQWRQFRRSGFLNHIAKDYTGDSATKQYSVYTLRYGGNRDTRYTMVRRTGIPFIN